MLLEICVDRPESVLAAVSGGAHRLEICSALDVGGLTPSEGLMAECGRVAAGLPMMAMIRPRSGDFVYSLNDLNVVHRDIETVRKLGASGIVFGALTGDGQIDIAATRDVVEAARPMAVTFHRAIDACQDSIRAIDDLIQLGVDRVLTSGRARTALEGAECLRKLVDRAGGELVVIAAGGVDSRNVQQLITTTKVVEVHASASTSDAVSLPPSWLGCGDQRLTSEENVRALVQALQ